MFKKLRNQFLLGFLVSLPLFITIIVLTWLFSTIDNFLQPSIRFLLGRSYTGLGFVIVLFFIYLVGLVASNVLGKRFINAAESLVIKVPLVRSLYGAVKQLTGTLSSPGRDDFQKVVLVAFPVKGSWTIGFVTNRQKSEDGEALYYIFVPTAPNPMSGFLLITKETEVTPLNVSVEQAMRMVMSAGSMLPPKISRKINL